MGAFEEKASRNAKDRAEVTIRLGVKPAPFLLQRVIGFGRV